MRVLGLIPARGGSKALPDKNILPLAGKPLIQRTYECAVESGALDRLILSTDSQRIIDLARSFGLEAPFVRPAEFATDEAPMIGVAIHALEWLADRGERYDALLLLQPTSPIRKPEHIRRALELLGENDAVCSVVSVPKDINPYYLMKVGTDGFLDFVCPEARTIKRRQDIPDAYRRDGTIFLTRTDVLLRDRNFYGAKCVPYRLDPEETLNIDTPDDWIKVEQRLMQEGG